MNELSKFIQNKYKDITLEVEPAKIVSKYKSQKRKKLAAFTGVISCFIIAIGLFAQLCPETMERFTTATGNFFSNIFTSSDPVNVEKSQSKSTSPINKVINSKSKKVSETDTTETTKSSSISPKTNYKKQIESSKNTQNEFVPNNASQHSQKQTTKPTETNNTSSKPNANKGNEKNTSETETSETRSNDTIYISGEYKYSIFDSGTAEIYEYLGNNSKSIIRIPEQLDGHKVTSIGYAAFYCHVELTNVYISETVKNIDESAFEFCSGLNSIIIPDNVTNIGQSAFQSCSRLTRVTIGNGITSINTNTFKYCKNLKSVSIGNNVKSICTQAFQSCRNLTKITIPYSVNNIEDYSMGYYSRNNTKIKNFTIVGYPNSEAKRYAEKNGFSFISQ